MKRFVLAENSVITPYEFDKIIIDRNLDTLFNRDKNGKILSVNREVYMIAAQTLLKEIEGENK